MDDREFLFFAGCIIGLTGLHMLHTWMIGKQLDLITDLQTDVSWLKDNTVAHETEARPGLCFSNTSSS